MLYEAPHRLEETLLDIREVLGDRQVAHDAFDQGETVVAVVDAECPVIPQVSPLDTEDTRKERVERPHPQVACLIADEPGAQERFDKVAPTKESKA